MRKKLILLVFIMSFVTGCSGKIEVNFNRKDIVVNLMTDFTSSEVISNYLVNYTEDYNEINPDSYVQDAVANRIIPAYKKGLNEIFSLEESNLENGNYYLKYKYKYKYNDFKNNYLFNNCFDNFVYKETLDEYLYEIKGKSNCYYKNMKLIVVSDYISNQNAEEIKGDNYIWNIKENNNNIKFSISKKSINKANDKLYNNILEIICVLAMCFGIYTYIKVKNNK